MKRKFIYIILGIICILILNIILRPHNIEAEVKSAFMTDSGYKQPVSDYIAEAAFDKINPDAVYKSDNQYTKPYKKNISVKQKFCVYFFYMGICKLNYTFTVRDAAGKQIRGSWNVPMYVILKRVKGKWIIVDEFEGA